MKPKNDHQRGIVALSAALPPVSEKQKQWAIDHVFSKKALLCKGKAWCTVCGETFASTISPLGATLLEEKVICPHCSAKLTAEHSRAITHKERWYYTIVTTFRGYQVCRNLSVEKSIRRGEQPFYEIHEVVQNWIDENGHEEVIAKPIAPIQYCYDHWALSKPMELRDSKRHDCNFPDKYRISGAWIYPKRRVLSKAKRNGYTGRNDMGLPESEHIRLLLTDREAETLEKNGQYSLLKWKYNHGFREFCMPYAHSIRIAIRNKYRVKDASLWMDYLELLSYFHLDTRNAHYVCPKNLQAAHDRLHERKERKEAKEYAERKRKEAAKFEADYKAQKGAYLGICFGNDDITITVLQSVAEFAEEGKAMHHCVYSANYFKKPHVLILSAKTKGGERLATIELSLKTYEVVQCRGVCNKVPDHYTEILTLINDHIGLFRKAA